MKTSLSASSSENQFTRFPWIDHLLSTFVFVAYLVEFLLVQGASTSLFFLLIMLIQSLLDGTVCLMPQLILAPLELRVALPRQLRQPIIW